MRMDADPPPMRESARERDVRVYDLPSTDEPPQRVIVVEIPHQTVSVTEIDLDFAQVVWLMVKWSIATIPAALILVVLSAVCWTLTIGTLAGTGQ